MVTRLSAVSDRAKIGLHRATRKTPAVTMVAAWMRALTGVGPSMASGSQTCSGSCADLPMAPQKSRMAIRVAVCTSPPKSGVVRPTSVPAWPKTSP